MPNINDRIFQGEHNNQGREEWFYRSREGIGGPYECCDDAIVALNSFVKFCLDNGFTGGREEVNA